MKRMKYLACGLSLVVLLSHGCARSQPLTLSPADWPAGELERYAKLTDTWGRPKTVADAPTAMVTGTTGALATRAGLEALRRGGTAADAAITTALAQIALAGGAWVSYAGMFNLVYFDAAAKKVSSLNAGWNTFKEESDPLSIPFCPTTSGRTAMVGGFMAGVEAAHRRFGKLPFASLFDPAIHFAEAGFPVSIALEGMIASRKDVLSRRPETKRIFTAPNGEFYRRGDLFRQPALAATLRRVATEGARYLYTGDWARRFVAAVQSDGGKVTLADLARYRVIWAEPVSTDYHGYQVFGPPPPNFGGTKMIEALNLLELANQPAGSRYWQSAEAVYWLTQIAHLSYVLGPGGAGMTLPDEWLARAMPGIPLSLAARATKATARLFWDRMHQQDWHRLKTEAVRETRRLAAAATARRAPSPGHSDAVAVIDGAGNVAALTHSINAAIWGWSGINVDGVSIADAGCYQQDLIRLSGAGNRLLDPTNPLIVMKDGQPFVAGASVGRGLHENTLQILINLLDYGVDPQAALEAPQFGKPDWDDQFNVSYLQAYPEGEFATDVVAGVRALGQEVRIAPKPTLLPDWGWWISIKRDPKTGRLLGGTGGLHNGLAEGY
jgi:gamma-glutamyltranspeptidase/glutathione hydrolase